MLSNGKVVIQSDLRNLTRDHISTYRVDDWRIEAFSNIISCLESQDFPCLFGRNALRKESLRFAFIGEHNSVNELTSVMTEFTKSIADTNITDRLYSPMLIIFKKADFQGLKEEHEFAWQRIQELHDNDTAPWPASVPSEVEDSAWSFCYGGVEFFINVSCPSHVQLKSRNLGNHVVFVINPREHFDLLASHKNTKGIKIREKIRKRVFDYNKGHVSKELGFYGDSDNLEWKQYVLSESDSKPASRCPLHMKKEGGRA